jgi:protoporphyrinogen oxidase
MKKIAVIGAGVSGISVAKMLQANQNEVIVFDKAAKPGGLVKCDRIKDNLFHRVGGHVFNAKNKDVFNWFWSQFDQEKEFIKAKRNAKIWFNDKYIGYPIENYLYQLDKELVDKIITDILHLSKQDYKKPEEYPHFEAFLKGNFGETLYETYFKPYNYKIWNTDLTKVPLGWLEGKLPMPNYKETLLSNIIKQEEDSMVHSTFYYAKEDGSQFIANRLAQGINIQFNSTIQSIERNEQGWQVNGSGNFDVVIYCGDVRKLHEIVQNTNNQEKMVLQGVSQLRSNGTSNIFCETDANDISWLYIPNPAIKAHRIIYTGNFAESNNRGSKRKTCVVEFSGKVSYEEMSEQIKQLPGNLAPLDYNYEPNSYVVQETETAAQIAAVKSTFENKGLYLLGRFAEWEYYNMDKAIEAAMNLSKKI